MRKMSSIVIFSVISVAALSFSFKNADAQNLSLQSSFNATAAVSGSGNAGIVFTGTEFWLSKWYNDSISSLSPSGTLISRFVVPGVSSIRAMTSDGTFIYATDDTRTIYKINPVTRTQVGTITVLNVIRMIAYTAKANGGAGGLWVGDDFGDLRLISLTGTVLQTIAEATHGLGSMSDLAFDSVTTNGGPYLWVFDRSVSGTGANLVRLPISTGVPNYTYNVLNDFPGSGYSAGADISYSLIPGQATLTVVLQSAPNYVARYINLSILPVTIVSFSGERKGTINTLKWKTATEQNSKVFELQRSVNGNNFTTIGSVASKAINGNSNAEINYTLDDIQPLKGDNYYRLKQIDRDGKTTFSSTVILKEVTVLKAEITALYPNPVISSINVSLTMPGDSKIIFTVTDMKGNLLIKSAEQAKTGTNNFTFKAENLTTGSYVLKATGNDGHILGEVKFIKQ